MIHGGIYMNVTFLSKILALIFFVLGAFIYKEAKKFNTMMGAMIFFLISLWLISM